MEASGQRVTTRRAFVGLFLLLQGIYLLTASGRVRIADEQEVYFQVESLLERGSLAVPQAVRHGVFFGRRGIDGKAYAPYGPATAFFAVGHHLIGRAVAAALGFSEEGPIRYQLLVCLTTFSTSTAGALGACAFLLLLLRLGLQLRRAMLWALFLGLGTFYWHYATVFYGEGFTTTLLVAGVAFFLGRRKRDAPLGALFLALAVLCKAPLLIFFPGLGLLVWGNVDRRDGRRRLLLLALAAVAAAAVHITWNQWRFGDPSQFGYNWTESSVDGEARPFSSPLWRGLLGLTLSPGRGLLFFAPPVLLSIWRFGAFWSRRKMAALGVAALALAGLALYSPYMYWAGGYCLGPRHLAPIAPFLLLPAALVAGSFETRRAGRILTLLCVAQQLLFVQVSFLEDQAIGSYGGESACYRWVEDEPGLPHNRYRLGYLPQATYPPRLAAGIAELFGGRRLALGTGWDLWAVHILKVTREDWGKAMPLSWVALLAAIGFAAALVGAGLLIGQARTARCSASDSSDL